MDLINGSCDKARHLGYAVRLFAASNRRYLCWRSRFQGFATVGNWITVWLRSRRVLLVLLTFTVCALYQTKIKRREIFQVPLRKRRTSCHHNSSRSLFLHICARMALLCPSFVPIIHAACILTKVTNTSAWFQHKYELTFVNVPRRVASYRLYAVGCSIQGRRLLVFADSQARKGTVPLCLACTVFWFESRYRHIFFLSLHKSYWRKRQIKLCSYT
jgi:hypothetical protein